MRVGACVCACVQVRARVRAYVRVCMCVCARARARVCVRACMRDFCRCDFICLLQHDRQSICARVHPASKCNSVRRNTICIDQAIRRTYIAAGTSTDHPRQAPTLERKAPAGAPGRNASQPLLTAGMADICWQKYRMILREWCISILATPKLLVARYARTSRLVNTCLRPVLPARRARAVPQAGRELRR